MPAGFFSFLFFLLNLSSLPVQTFFFIISKPPFIDNRNVTKRTFDDAYLYFTALILYIYKCLKTHKIIYIKR